MTVSRRSPVRGLVPPVLLLALLAAGCAPTTSTAAPRSTPDFSSVTYTDNGSRTSLVDLRRESSIGERTVSASPAQVWAVLPAVFAQLGIETTKVDSSEGVMGNPGYRARRIEGRRMSEYLDCGRTLGREYADSYAVTLAVLVQLVSSPDGGTVVRTVLDAYASDPSMNTNAVHCITWGSLERRIGELVAERLAA